VWELPGKLQHFKYYLSIFIVETAHLISYTIHWYYVAPIWPLKNTFKWQTYKAYIISALGKVVCSVKTAVMSLMQKKPLVCKLFQSHAKNEREV
jgi:hypothetical protein